MPARITLPAVGACTWASGSQVCSGNSGTLIAKPANRARKIEQLPAAAAADARPGRCVSAANRESQRVLAVVLIVPEHDGQQAQEREQAAGQREQEELDRRVAPLFAAPDADQEEQRDQRELEEDVEQDDVAGREDAQAAELQQQQHGIEQRRAVVDRLPAHQHRRDEQQGGEAEQPDAEAVEADAEADIEPACRPPASQATSVTAKSASRVPAGGKVRRRAGRRTNSVSERHRQRDQPRARRGPAARRATARSRRPAAGRSSGAVAG